MSEGLAQTGTWVWGRRVTPHAGVRVCRAVRDGVAPGGLPFPAGGFDIDRSYQRGPSEAAGSWGRAEHPFVPPRWCSVLCLNS